MTARDGRVEAVYVAPEAGAPMESVDGVEAVAGRGLRGDRYFDDAGTFGDGEDKRNLTLVEAEAVEAAEDDYGVTVPPGAHRRNVVVRGVALNHLVDERFRVGEAACVGAELCEPCGYLEDLVGEAGLRESLVHRGGLRARVVETGAVEPGDPVGDDVPS